MTGAPDVSGQRRLRPLTEWPLAERAAIRGVLTDIDDTLSEHGQIAPAALQALFDLKAAGLQVIAITGRPIGLCWNYISGEQQKPWPVDAVVAENGALGWDCRHRPPVKCYQQTASERAENRRRMQAVAQRVLREVPGAALTGDGEWRETDLTFDHAELCTPDMTRTQRIVDILRAEGMQTSVSSIHIHGCFGDFDKWQGANWIVQLLGGEDLHTALSRWVCIGDSGNDQPMFQHFQHSVGVANIRSCAHNLEYLPRFITQAERGAGFAEMAQALLEARRA